MIENFNVSLFDKERKIRVYLPNDYAEKEKKYPVLYMHDGQNVFDDKESIGGVSLDLHKHLDQNKVDMIVVAIDQNTEGEERINEYCPWKHGEFSQKILGSLSSAGGKGKDYLDFIVHDLKPLIDTKYRTEETQTYMAGISLGALITTYAAGKYPNIFKRVAAISSGYYRNQEAIEAFVKTSDLSSIERFYLDCGLIEAGENDPVSEWALQSNQAIYEIVKEKTSSIRFDIIEDGRHHYQDFKKRVPAFISYLL